MSLEQANKGSQRARIGRYEVVEHIATGGMGAVYKAIDVDLNRVVALKILSPELSTNKIMLARFKREARSAATLRHENIVAIYEYNEDKDMHYLALEFVDGKDLHDLINKKGKLSAEEARAITIQAAQALDHAYSVNIVHRDIKPSNFLITSKNGQLLVKLTDLGLARQVQNEEFQVTRPGTTVGTVDYMSPEQARDSQRADIRSDIYSLGCTLYHMLAGVAPFAQGSLTERIYKHIEMKPPDIKQFNAEAPDYLVGIMAKMLEKNAEDRYQTPAELIHDLENRTGPVQEVVEDTPAPVKKARPKPSTAKPPSKAKKLKPATGTLKKKPVKSKRLRSWLPIAAGAGALAVLAVVLWAFSGGVPTGPPVPPEQPPVRVETPPKVEPIVPPVEPPPVAVAVGPEHEPVVIMGPDPPTYKPLYVPRLPLNGERRERLWQEVAGPYAGFVPEAAAGTVGLLLSPPGPLLATVRLHPECDAFNGFPRPRHDAVVLRVSRFAAPKSGLRTLSEAFAALPPGKHSIIEINDNGPIFVPDLPELRNGQVWIRGAAGFRPLITWTVDDKKPAGALFSVIGGRLTLEDVDVVLRTGTAASAVPAYICKMTNGDCFMRRCTFTIAGGYPVTLVQMARGSADMPRRCCFSDVFARGSNLAAVSTLGGAADIFVQRCLLVGGERPMFDLVGQDIDVYPTSLRFVRSSLVAMQTLIRLQNMKGQGDAPRLRCLTWDALLACASTRSATTVLAVANGGRPDNVQWRPTNTLYVGWKNLLDSGPGKISGAALDVWRSRWFHDEGDAAVPLETWPGALPARIEEAVANDFDPHGSPVAFAATLGSGTIGADPGRLPAPPRHWLERTYESYTLATVDLLENVSPRIPSAEDGLYHGESIDVMQGNLGQIIQQRLLEKKDLLAPRLVFHLIGSGERPTAPVRVHGVRELVLCVDPPPTGSPPLVLTPEPASTADRAALIDIEDGNLDLVGVSIRFDNSKFALTPNHMIKVQRGSLRTSRCLFRGPTNQPAAGFRGVIAIDNSSSTTVNVAVKESILVSGRRLIAVQGGAAHLRVKHSILVAIDDGLHIDASSTPLASVDLQCQLENSTLAFGKAAAAFFWHGEGQTLDFPFVLHCNRCVFVDPFLLQPNTSTMLQTDRATLARGLIRWQGEANAFDKRCGPLLTVEDEKLCSTPDAWERFWGQSEARSLVLDLPDNKRYDLNLETPELDHLTLPTTLRVPVGEPLPGADLAALGIFRKRTN